MVAAFPASAASSSAHKNAPLNEVGHSTAHLLGAARVAAGFGIVTSGYRSPAHNRRVGGVPTSHHLFGRAIDVARRPGVTHQMVEIALRRAGFVLVESLDERDHSHFAFAAALPTFASAIRRNITPLAAPSKPSMRPVLADNHGILLAASPTLAIAAGQQRK